MTESIVKRIQDLEIEITSTKEKDKQYQEAIELFESMIKKGFIIPRGYCLPSIADYSLSTSSFYSDEDID